MILINGVRLEVSKFPNGESKIITPTNLNSFNKILLKWTSDEDLIHLMFVKDYLDEHNLRAGLSIVYMPYSRMDRYIQGTLFTLKSVCKFINALDFEEVVVMEPHSDVTTALIDHCTTFNGTEALFERFKPENIDYIFYPDAGAQKRYSMDGYKGLVGFKKRNLETGRIEQYDVLGEFEEGATIVILDDLSSYGGTFTLAAQALKDKGAGDIYLIIAHAETVILKGKIFSDGNIKKVLTTNSIIDSKEQTDQLQIEEIY